MCNLSNMYKLDTNSVTKTARVSTTMQMYNSSRLGKKTCKKMRQNIAPEMNIHPNECNRILSKMKTRTREYYFNDKRFFKLKR